MISKLLSPDQFLDLNRKIEGAMDRMTSKGMMLSAQAFADCMEKFQGFKHEDKQLIFLSYAIALEGKTMGVKSIDEIEKILRASQKH